MRSFINHALFVLLPVFLILFFRDGVDMSYVATVQYDLGCFSNLVLFLVISCTCEQTNDVRFDGACSRPRPLWNVGLPILEQNPWKVCNSKAGFRIRGLPSRTKRAAR